MRRVTAVLMRLFPGEFRARYGAELGDLLAQRARDVRRNDGWLAASRMLLFQSTDLVLAARAERRAARSGVGAARALRGGKVTATPSLSPQRGPRGLARWRALIAGDLRLALRALQRAPGFLLAAGLTLAIGIGATTAIFTVINGVLLAPLPYPDPDSLVAVWLASEPLGYDAIDHTTSSYLTFRDNNDVFAEFGTYTSGSATITGDGDEPERVDTMGVTDGALRALGAHAELGRLYAPADVEPGAAPKLLLSYGFWQRRYGGDAGIVGDLITIDGQSAEVIGVLPADFRFLDAEPSVYWPIRLDPNEMPTVLSFDYKVLGRLAPGVTEEQASAALSSLLPASIERYQWLTPEQAEGFALRVRVRPLKEAVVGNVGRVLWILFGSVGIVLLIACANVANLFLVRAETRRQEIAVRTALGASRGVLVRQFIVESVLLGVIGGFGGLLVAYAGVPLLLGLAPSSLPRAAEIGVDPLTLGFCFVISCLAGLVFGIFPVSYYGAPDLVPALKAGARGASEGRRGNRLRSLLVVGEVALALVLLVGAGLMVRSFLALGTVDSGLRDPQRALTFRVALPRGDYPDNDQAVLAFEQILTRIEAIPGVESAGAASGLTMEFHSNQNSFLAEGAADNDVINGAYKAVAGDYFEAAGIPLLAGRTITWDDVRQRNPVGLVTESLAKHYWGSAQAAIGQRIRHAGNDPWREIIGVVGDIRDGGLRDAPPPVAFWPVVVYDFLGFDSWLRRDLAFVVRTRTDDPAALLPQVREAVWAVDPNLPLSGVDTLDAVVRRYMASTTFMLVMLAVAAAVAVLLGTIGIYGVIAYAFAQRQREIGIRIALGAANGAIRAMVLRHGLMVGGAGVLVGLAGAFGLTRFLQSLLFETGTLDPLTYVIAALLTGGVAVVASYLPALRATRVNPVETLRR
ncbi:MAG: ABC transporter permease [Acidobacteriota bacterium]